MATASMHQVPSFELELLHAALENDFNKLIVQQETTLEPPQPLELYKIEEKFLEKDRYWTDKVWGDRFNESLEKGILFRSAVVKKLCSKVQDCLSKQGCRGLVIKGPQGIGKSHSIVNLVRQLLYRSDCKYFVTFIPNCEHWTSAHDLFELICASFGSSPNALGVRITGNQQLDQILLEEFVEAIDAKLAEQGRQWVFIFDQINTIFALYHDRKDITMLPFPFNYMHLVMKAGRITTIISASASNEIAYREIHSDFQEYHHVISFTRDELMNAFPTLRSLGDEVIKSIMDITEGVPLQVQQLLKHRKEGAVVPNIEQYEENVQFSVKVTLRALTDQIKKVEYKKELTKSTCCCLLHIPLKGKPQYYDRNYSVSSKDLDLKPLFPAVSGAYRDYFWEELMKYVKEKEKKHLAICNEETTTEVTLERIFKHLVIARCINGDLALCTTSKGIAKHEFPGLKKCQLVKSFLGQKLPKYLRKDGMYVPMNLNFPAIDLIWKMGQNIWFVRVHVIDNTDVKGDLEELLKDVEWKNGKNIFLLYLNPTQSVSNSLSKKLFNLDESSPLKAVLAMPFTHFKCLKNLQWPKRDGSVWPVIRSAKPKPDETTFQLNKGTSLRLQASAIRSLKQKSDGMKISRNKPRSLRVRQPGTRTMKRKSEETTPPKKKHRLLR